MPPLVPQPGVLKITTRFNIGEDLDVGTRWFFSYTGTPWTDAQAVTASASILASFVTRLIAVLGTDNKVVGVTVEDLSTPTSAFGETFATTVGTRGGTPLPAGSCCLVNHTILRRYRGGKPRTYWPLLNADDLLDPQTWKGTSINDVNVGLTLYFDDIRALAVGAVVITNLVNVSYYHGFTPVLNPITGRTRDVPTPRAVAIAPDVVQSFVCNPRVGSQRRRNLHGS
jgi:hypothetical protein